MSKTRNPNGYGTFRKRKSGRVEWRLKKDGIPYYRSAKTPEELKRKINELAIAPSGHTKLKVNDWFTNWLKNYVEPIKKENTYKQYKGIYEKHIKPEIGSIHMIKIKSFDIQAVISTMNKKGLSSWTMKHARKIMSLGFKRAVKEKIIKDNPVEDIEIPTKQARERKVLTDTELTQLFDYMGKVKSRWLWSVKFLLVTGLRRSEMLSLKWSDIEWDNDRIAVRRSSQGDTKSSKIHYAPLSQKAIDAIENQAKMLKAEYNQNLDLIFPSEDGNPMPPNSYYTAIRRMGIKAGVHVSPHMFRHTFTYYTRNKLSLKELQNALGHEESTTTLDIYGNMIADNSTDTANAIDEAFNEIKKKKKPMTHLRRIK